MKTKYIFLTVLILAIGGLILLGNSTAIAKNETPPQQPDSPIIIYKPPMRGAPANRMGGGTRGLTRGLNELSLKALVPNHTGLTTHRQPILYWYISPDVLSKRIVFTLNDEENGVTLFQTNLDKLEKDGIQALNLADYKISLETNKEYSWFITMVIDPNNPSLDISSVGNIKRIIPSAALSEKLAKADSKDIPAIYAQEGIWYDALSSLCQLIALHPENKYFYEQRTMLLEQIGLNGIKSSD